MKLIKNFYSKFQNRFKTKSKSKLITLFLFALPFLPIFPYVRNSESIFLFGFIEGSVDNFYETGISEFFNSNVVPSENSSKYEQGRAFYDLNKLYEDTVPSGQRDYLIKEGFDKELASCISIRDLFYNDYYLEINKNKMMNRYTPSPVPLVWFIRSALVRTVLDEISSPELTEEQFKKFNAKCSKYGKLFLPKNYQKGDFSY